MLTPRFIHRSSRIASLLFAIAVIATAGSSFAEDKDEKAKNAVPLKKVVLFNSGVGFFEHRGDVEGNAQVEMKFNVDDINDLLKSMVLQDLGKGQISTVTYGSRDPITKTLKTFAIDLTTNPTLAQLLEQVRGEVVEVESANKVTGTILGIEKRRKQVGDKEVIEIEYLNLLTDGGLRSIPLDTVGRIKLANPKLDAELRQALTILALGHANDKKTVTLNFRGEGKRPVRVGYIQETPVWKTSYRLVLKDDEAPMLQGWAIVENTTEEDWNDVALTLMSGRPISFVMDLYQPLYVSRPVVVPELFASLRPRTYDQDLVAKNEDFQKRGEAAALRETQEKLLSSRDVAAKKATMPAKADRLGANRQLARAADAAPGFAGKGAEAEAEESDMLRRGVQSAANAGDVGELFKYDITEPVTLQRQRSAMLPIVNGDIQGEKVSIYNPQVHQKHPLNGLKFKNSTKLHLMQGPITVFDGGTYAGDARIEDLPPGTERLISYAMDLDTEVAPTMQGIPEELTSVAIVKGTLNSSRKFHRTQVYTVKNSGQKPKKVLIEYPHDASWTLVAPKEPAEKTRNQYRFAVIAEPGKPAQLSIQEEQIQNQSVALANLDNGMIQFYINAKVVSDKVKDALRDVIKRKNQLGELAAQRGRLQQQINIIAEEQNRIRQNMAQLEKNTELYNKYLKKFTEQEDLNDKLRADIQKLVNEEALLQKALNEFLISVTLS